MKQVLFASIAAAAILAAVSAQASVITNTPDGNEIIFWGPGSYTNQAYGLVFTAPDAVLNSFSLTVRDGGSSFPFEAQVYAWNSGVTGSALYTSGVNSTTSTETTYTFNSNIALTVGGAYLALVTNQPNGVSLGGTGYGYMAAGTGPASFHYSLGAPTANSWYTYGQNAAFSATFSSAAPEASTWAMMLIGFAGLGFAGYRASRKNEAGAAA